MVEQPDLPVVELQVQVEELAFLNEVSSVPLQQGLRHLQSAFAAFFDKRSRYPRFKSRKRGRQSAEYTRSAFRWRDGRLTLAKMTEPLAIRWYSPGNGDREMSAASTGLGRPPMRSHSSLICRWRRA